MSYQESTDQPPAEEKKKRGGLVLILLSVLLIAGGIGFAVWSFLPGSDPNALRDMNGQIVTPDDPSATSPEFMEQAQMVEDDGGDGFVVPAVNLDVPLGSVNEVNGVMNPAGYTSVFTIRNRGAGSVENAAQGTVYMVTHAVYDGTAPGNALQSGGQVALSPGDIIKADNKEYRFESAEVIDKNEIGDHADLWTNDPGRLIVITCVVDGAPNANLVMIARLAS